jgi:hypothetical protein
MLTTPKRGSEMRRELGVRADEIATKAKDEWVPIFQREDTTTNGHGVETLAGESLSGTAIANLQEGAAAGGAATADAAEAAANETADAINDAYDGVDREPTA